MVDIFLGLLSCQSWPCSCPPLIILLSLHFLAFFSLFYSLLLFCSFLFFFSYLSFPPSFPFLAPLPFLFVLIFFIILLFYYFCSLLPLSPLYFHSFQEQIYSQLTHSLINYHGQASPTIPLAHQDARLCPPRLIPSQPHLLRSRFPSAPPLPSRRLPHQRPSGTNN